MASAAADTVEQLVSDATLQPLLGEGFDAKAFATGIIQCQMVGETLQKLTNGITALDKELYTQVVTNYEDLLSQATGIEALESVLKMMQTRIDSLRTAVDRISTKVVDPYQKIVARTTQLARLQATCDLLRKVIRMLYLMKRLKSQMQGGSREITKVAQTFSEIDQLTQGGELNGIQILEEEKAWLARTRREVESQAKRMVMQGLELMNPTQVGVSLQVFHNLGQLSPTLLSLLMGYSGAIQHEIQNALDPATLMQGGEVGGGPGRSTLPTLGSSASWKAALWTRLDKLANSIHKSYSQVHQLHVVLVKKRDPMTQVSFLESITGTDAHQLLTHFWDSITENLRVELTAAAKASTFLNQAFESDYPKLVRAFSDLLSRVEQLSIPESQPSGYLQPPVLSSNNNAASSAFETALIKALSPFEKAYLSRSLSRLFESVNQLFGPGGRSLPREDELHNIIKTITSELAAASGSSPLGGVIARNVEKTVKLFNNKCEQMMSTNRDSLQVSGPPNSAQLRNIAIVNTLHAFNKLMTENILSLSALSQSASVIIAGALEPMVTQMQTIVSLFVEEVQRVLEQMVASMHQESFAGELKEDSVLGTPDAPCSGFMREMQSFTARIHSQHLSRYHCQEEVGRQLREVTVRVLELYVCHVCLLRPLSEGGKMRVATDTAQVELALAPFHSKLAELGRPYKMLRALRRLLFLASEHLLTEASGIGDALPYSCALNYLFSRAPRELKSPHQVQGWSQKEYSDWMDRQLLEKDRLAFIQATLDTYANKVRSQGHSQYAPIYPVMIELLKRGLEKCS